MATKPLTAVAVANARAKGAPRELPDGGCRGLYLVVRPTGSKTWVVRYRFRGLSRKLTLGPALIGASEPSDAPQLDTPLSLMAARQLATAALRQAKSGTDPAAEKRQKREAERAAEADTLQAVAEEFLRREGAGLRTLDQRSADLKLLYDKLGALPIEQIKRGQFVRVFDNIADTRGPVRADRVQNAAKRLLSWHADRGEYINVLAGTKRRISIRERARDRVLSNDELQAVWIAAETFPAPFGPYVRFLLLTAARRNEAAGLRRSELLDAATWVLPKARWKSGRKATGDLLIPLSKAAQAIIAAQPPGEFIFSSSGERGLTNLANHKTDFNKACGLTERWMLHDLRRTSRTLLSRLTTPDIAERAVGHVIGGVRGTYDRHEYEAEKREAFEKLAVLIQTIAHPPPTEDKVADLAAERSKRLAHV